MTFSARRTFFVLWVVATLISARIMTAQTAPAAVPLDLNETITGRLNGRGNSITYTFERPVDQDIVIVLEADKTVLDRYCVRVAASAECSPGGGGGGDAPVSRTVLISAHGDSDAPQTVEYTLTRPLDNAVQYQLSAYTLTPEPLSFGEDREVEATAARPYQVYTLEADPEQLFTLEIEDAAPDGAFLWAAHQPYMADAIPLSDEPLLLPRWLDGATRPDDPDGIAQIQLYYLGGQSFRALVVAGDTYTLYADTFDIMALPENQTFTTTVSYRNPLQVVRFDTQSGDTALVRVRVDDGTGALVAVYTEGELVSDSLALGTGSAAGTVFPLSGTIEHDVETDAASYAVIQIPYEFTRDQVTLSVNWQRQ